MMDMKRGEIWLVNLDPVLGAEIRKTRLKGGKINGIYGFQIHCTGSGNL